VDKLQAYRDKRDAARTPEPVPAESVPAESGEAQAGENPDGGTFVIQEHHARRLHWDFRLERDGVLVQPGFFYDFESEAYLVVSLLTGPGVFREGLERIRARVSQ